MLKYKVYAGGEEIFDGVLYSNLFSMLPPFPHYIFYDIYGTYNTTILKIEYNINYADDKRNDQRIINTLKENNLLHSGITCRIDCIKRSDQNDSSLIASGSVSNHDDENYNIPDIEKLVEYKNNFVGWIDIHNNNTTMYYWPTNNNIGMLDSISIVENMKLLPGNSKVEFTFETKYNQLIERGSYNCILRYTSVMNYNQVKLNVTKENGTLWVGEIFQIIDSIKLN